MDEIELVTNYSVLQRARSYAELARWMGQATDEKYPGLVLIGAVIGSFANVVLNEKEDRDKAAPRLRARQREEDNIAAAPGRDWHEAHRAGGASARATRR